MTEQQAPPYVEFNGYPHRNGHPIPHQHFNNHYQPHSNLYTAVPQIFHPYQPQFQPQFQPPFHPFPLLQNPEGPPSESGVRAAAAAAEQKKRKREEEKEAIEATFKSPELKREILDEIALHTSRLEGIAVKHNQPVQDVLKLADFYQITYPDHNLKGRRRAYSTWDVFQKYMVYDQKYLTRPTRNEIPTAVKDAAAIYRDLPPSKMEELVKETNKLNDGVISHSIVRKIEKRKFITQINDRAAYLESMGIETVILISDITDPAGLHCLGSSNGLAFENGALTRIGLGIEGFHAFCRGRAILDTINTLVGISEEGITDEVLKMVKAKKEERLKASGEWQEPAAPLKPKNCGSLMKAKKPKRKSAPTQCTPTEGETLVSDTSDGEGEPEERRGERADREESVTGGREGGCGSPGVDGTADGDTSASTVADNVTTARTSSSSTSAISCSNQSLRLKAVRERLRAMLLDAIGEQNKERMPKRKIGEEKLLRLGKTWVLPANVTLDDVYDSHKQMDAVVRIEAGLRSESLRIANIGD